MAENLGKSINERSKWMTGRGPLNVVTALVPEPNSENIANWLRRRTRPCPAFHHVTGDLDRVICLTSSSNGPCRELSRHPELPSGTSLLLPRMNLFLICDQFALS